jgi:sugar phosphate isomerase/epimerase
MDMIKYAVMTFMYNGWVNSDDGSHEELIKILGESGVEGIEAFANHFMENDALLKLYQKEMKSNGLTMPVMDLLANPACSDKKQRDEAYNNTLIRKRYCSYAL